MSPDNAEFHFDWNVNGIEVNAIGKILPLQQNVSGDIPIEVTVSSDCGASDAATIFVEREFIDPTDPTEPCPTVTTMPATVTTMLATGKHMYNTLVMSKCTLITVTEHIKTSVQI